MATKAAFRWNSGAGEQTLTGAASESRFNGWTMNPHDVGEEATAVGDGVGYKYALREDYEATFRLSNIASTDAAKVSDFVKWVNRFGQFAIDTADTSDRSYEACQVTADGKAVVSPPDPQTLDLEITLTARNIAIAPAPLLCLYD